jgi:hypothetical protein
MKIRCITTFDITPTGVRSNFNANRIPFSDDQGNLIDDSAAWTRSRNQQRNWETINQLIALRCLPHSITDPEPMIHDSIRTWQFEFEVDDISMISQQGEDLALLKQDCRGIPMITGLGETARQIAYLDPDHNIVFAAASR